MARSDERSSARTWSTVERVEERTGERLADDAHHLHTFTRHQLPQCRRIEPLVVAQHDGAAAVEGGGRHPERGGVHEGRRGQEGRGALAGPHGARGVGRLGARAGRLPALSVVVVDPPDDPLRTAGRATGVEEQAVVAGGRPIPGCRSGGCGGELRLVVAADGQEQRRPRATGDGGRLGHRVGGTGMEDDRAGVAVGEHVRQLPGDVLVVEVHRRGAQFQRRRRTPPGTRAGWSTRWRPRRPDRSRAPPAPARGARRAGRARRTSGAGRRIPPPRDRVPRAPSVSHVVA